MEDHYSSEEEEVYFGSLAESEAARRRRFLGSNYNSPVTPRPPRFNQASNGIQGGLPDVLGTSTPVLRQQPAGSGNNQSTQHNLPLDDSLDDVIILDASGNSNSVITLSDDESFIRNEETCSNKSATAENVNVSVENTSVCDNSNSSDTAEISKPHRESSSTGKDFVSNSVVAEDSGLHESAIHNSENENSLNDNSASISEISIKIQTAPVIEPHHGNFSSGKDYVSISVIAGDESLHESAINNSENKNSVNDSSVFNNEVSIKNKTAPVIEPHHGNCTSGKDILSNSVIAGDESLQESAANNSENGNSLNDYNSFSYFATNIRHTTADKCELRSNVENISSSLVQDIDEFVGDSNIPEKSSAAADQITVGQNPIIPSNLPPINSSSGEKGPETSSFNASKFLLSKELPELQKSVNSAREETDTSARKHGKNSLVMSDLSNLEFSLNGVTDSILNISHGSSLPSPPDTYQSSGKQTNLFEDISFDNEQLGNIADISNFDEKNYEEDLHMSVDEIDFQLQRFTNNFVALSSLENSTISQPSEYKSCPSAHSSYSTAYDKTCENHSTSVQSNSFQNYRDASTDLDICSEMDEISIKSNEENRNETNFEMVMQNRQNSFNGTPASKMSQNNKEGGNSQVMSKLPVYQSSKCLLRPPKFYVNPDTLKISSYKFAKQISKTGSENHSLNLPKPEICKIPGPSTLNKHIKSPSTREKKIPLVKENPKTPSKIGTPKPNTHPPKQFSSLSKSKIPSHSYLSINKTPAQNILNKSPTKNAVNKTPVQNIVNKSLAKSVVNKSPAKSVVNKSPAKSVVNRTPAENISGIPRVVKSDSKVNRVLTPLRNYNMSALSAGKSIPSKNKYKNIISPIQSYIRGNPPVSQRKAQVISEEQECPERQQTKPENFSAMKLAPKALQKLSYENVQGQENVNPNVIDPSRDTLPCKILEPSLEVFWKEREQPEPRLPKMGEKLTKILASSPKIKVTIHEGLAEPIQFLFTYLGEDYEDYCFNREDWPRIKQTMPWGKSPVFKVEGKPATQSIAISCYLDRTAGLCGADAWESLRIDEIIDAINDLRVVAYEPDEKRKAVLRVPLVKDIVPLYLKRLDNIVKENNGYLANKKLSWADLYFVAILDYLNHIYGSDLILDIPI